MKKKYGLMILVTMVALVLIFLSTTQLALIPVDDLSRRVSTMPIIPEIDSELVELSFIDNIYNNIDVLIDWLKSIYSQLLQIIVR